MGKHDAAKQDLKAARERLNNLPDNASESTYQTANDAVVKAEKALPWRKR